VLSGIWLAGEPVKGIGSLPPGVQILIAVAIVALAAILFRAAQTGSRVPASRANEPGAPRREPDDCWKLGVFYYNPDDPAVFIEKRSGLGYTVNFGNTWGWVITIAIVFFTVAPVVWLRAHFLSRAIHR
jgi:uncharacterized membrane protein